MQNFIRNSFLSILVLCNIGCDQISKNIVRKSVDYGDTIPLINNIFTLTRVENKGAFLSFGDSLPWLIKFTLLTLLPVVALLFGLYVIYFRHNLSVIMLTAICFVIGGGIGNLFDRIAYGSVTDFLHLDMGIFETGIFNLADVSIMIGMFIIIFDQYIKKKPEMSHSA